MIWRKTALGLAEARGRSQDVDPTVRNLLLLIDGVKSEDMLLRHGIGVRPEQFRALYALGLIEPVTDDRRATPPSPPAVAPAPSSTTTRDEPSFAAALGRLISAELGFAGFGLAEKVQKARSVVELHDIAEGVIALIRERKGAAAAETATRQLFGPR